MAENFDVVVIGAGPGGYVAAIRAAQLKQKVAIVDKQWLGGVCLNVGCIPSKSLLKNAEVAHTLRERGKDFGFSFDNLKLDFGVAVKRSRQVSDRLVKGVGFLMKKNNITVFMGEALQAETMTLKTRMARSQSFPPKTSSWPRAQVRPFPVRGKWTAKKLSPISKRSCRRNFPSL
jgi:dihydrolipoamide dehydrogenase